MNLEVVLVMVFKIVEYCYMLSFFYILGEMKEFFYIILGFREVGWIDVGRIWNKK